MVRNLEKSLKWYTEVLGFEPDSCYPETNPVYYYSKTDGGACFAIGFDENATPNGRFNFQTENTDELWEQLKDKVTIIEPIWDTPWGQGNLLSPTQTTMSWEFVKQDEKR